MKIIKKDNGITEASHQFNCKKCNSTLEIQYRDLEGIYVDKDSFGRYSTLKQRCKCPVCWEYNIFDKIPQELLNR